MTQGVLLRIFVLQAERHHGVLLYEWLLRSAREMGITGGAAFREVAGYGHHDRLHEQLFFELAGDLPAEVVFAMTQSDSEQFLDLLARERLSLFTSGVRASSAAWVSDAHGRRPLPQCPLGRASGS